MGAAYLSYEEYKDMGGSLPMSSFTLLEFQSRKRIDHLTASRVSKMQVIPDSVKLCIMLLIQMEDSVGTVKQSTSPAVTSFSTDGYSETYGKAMDADTANRAMNRTVAECLSGEVDDNGTPLLYRGLDR